MRIKDRKPSIPLIGALVLGALITTGFLTYAYSSASWPFSNPDATVEETTSNDNIDDSSEPDKKNDRGTSETNVDNNPTSNQPVQFTPPEDTTNQKHKVDKLTGVINFASISEGNLIIRTTIKKLENSGECTLTLVSETSGKTITKTADIIANPSSSSCRGFSIPESQLIPGKWTITIKLKSGNDTGSLQKTINL